MQLPPLTAVLSRWPVTCSPWGAAHCTTFNGETFLIVASDTVGQSRAICECSRV
jgi:hypothetical protein